MAGKTSKSAWTQRERDAASLFGSRRQVCSGSSNRPDRSRSDSRHDVIFLETKLRQHHAAVTLFDQTRKLARLEGKVPVVALATKHRAGLVLMIAPEDLRAVADAMEIPADIPTPATPEQLGRSADDSDLALVPSFPSGGENLVDGLPVPARAEVKQWLADSLAPYRKKRQGA
jgi:hypothetical protein